MKWRTVAASVIGTSHAERGEACQDECWASSGLDEPRPFLSIFAADGAGSASHGGMGARLAVEAAVAYLEATSESDASPLTDVARGCFLAARERLRSEAESQGLVPRDLACTFLGVMSSDTECVVIQIGDGAVVVDVGDGLLMPITPMNGPYLNTTRFIVDDDACEQMAVVPFDRPAQRVAVLSDGIQGIATNLAAATPHEPFFAPFFQTLASDAAEGQDDELLASLTAFLGSKRVNARTDDDKTLALAVAVS